MAPLAKVKSELMEVPSNAAVEAGPSPLPSTSHHSAANALPQQANCIDYYALMMTTPVEYKATESELKLLRLHKCTGAVWIPMERDLLKLYDRDRQAQRHSSSRKERALRNEKRRAIESIELKGS